MTTKLMYLITAYYTPKNGFTANDASFYSQCLQLIVYDNIKITKRYYRTS